MKQSAIFGSNKRQGNAKTKENTWSIPQSDGNRSQCHDWVLEENPERLSVGHKQRWGQIIWWTTVRVNSPTD